MKKKGKIIIVEGTSGVGKTTLCNNLLNCGWKIIPEHLPNEGREGIVYPQNEEEEKSFQKLLMEREYKKIVMANEIVKDGNNVVIDKSYIAVVASAVAIQKKESYIGTAKNALNIYIELLKKLKNNNLTECDGMIIFTADEVIVRERCEKRGTLLDLFWVDSNTLELQNKTLKALTQSKFHNNIPVCYMDTTNLSAKKVFNRSIDFINNNLKEKEWR